MKKYVYYVNIIQVDNVDYLPESAELIYESQMKFEDSRLLSSDEVLDYVYENLEVTADTPDVWEGEYSITIEYDIVIKENQDD